MANFIHQDSGAVTVDWVVLTAGLVGLGLATMAVVSTGVQDASGDINTTLSDPNIVRHGFGVSQSNEGFENVFSGGTPMSSVSVLTASIPGWEIMDGNSIEVIDDTLTGGFNAPEGRYFVDMGTNGTDVALGTDLALRQGETTTLSFHATNLVEGNAMEVWYGGELVDTVTSPADLTWQSYEYELTGGAGDGSNRVELREVGTQDDTGTLVDGIAFQ